MVKNTVPAPRGISDLYIDPQPQGDYYQVSAAGEISAWIQTQDNNLWKLEYQPYDAAWRTRYLVKGQLVTILQLKWSEK